MATKRQYLEMLTRAKDDGNVVKWHRGYVYYVSGPQGKQPNSKVTHTKHGFVCGCDEFAQTGYCVHCAVARQAAVQESGHVDPPAPPPAQPQPQVQADNVPVFWSAYQEKFNS